MRCGALSLKVKWTKRALNQLQKALEYIAEDNVLAAQSVAHKIYKATELIKEQPEIGRQGRVKNTREWVVKNTSYLLVYRYQNETIFLLAIIHSKQDWPKIFNRV